MTRIAPWLWVIQTPTYSVLSQSFIFSLSAPKRNAQWPASLSLSLSGWTSLSLCDTFHLDKTKEKKQKKQSRTTGLFWPQSTRKKQKSKKKKKKAVFILRTLRLFSLTTGFRLASGALPPAAPPHKRFQHIMAGARRTVRPTPFKALTAPPCHKLHHICQMIQIQTKLWS